MVNLLVSLIVTVFHVSVGPVEFDEGTPHFDFAQITRTAQ